MSVTTTSRQAATGASAGAQAAGGASVWQVAHYPHLRFTATSDKLPLPTVLQRLDALGAHLGKTITITSGFRNDRDQAKACAGNANPCAAPGTSPHRYGVAADATIGGTAIQHVVSGPTLRQFGLIAPVANDPVHVELTDKHGGRLLAALSDTTKNDLYMGLVAGNGFGKVSGSANVAAGGGGGLAVITPTATSLPQRALDALKEAVGGFSLGPVGSVVSGVGTAVTGHNPLPTPSDIAGAVLPSAADIAKAIVKFFITGLDSQVPGEPGPGAYAATTAVLVIGGAALIVLGAMRASGYPRTQAAPTS